MNRKALRDWANRIIVCPYSDCIEKRKAILVARATERRISPSIPVVAFNPYETLCRAFTVCNSSETRRNLYAAAKAVHNIRDRMQAHILVLQFMETIGDDEIFWDYFKAMK